MLSLLLVLGTLVAQTPKQAHHKATIHVSGNCGMCKKNIETALTTDGVDAAYWNPDTRKLRIKYDPARITLSQIHQRIASAGYDTDQLKADETAYKGLAKCCQYRDAKCTHEGK
jgi:periplasmic mercuric ion binding protein